MSRPAGNSERRPAATGRRSELTPTRKLTRTQGSPETPLFPPTLPWARALIDGATGPVPDYGSPEWEALADGPEKVAATVVAAEAWRTYWDPQEHARRLHAELDAARQYEEEARWSRDIVEQVHRTARQPSHAELCRRRGEPEAEARANDHRRRLELPVEHGGDDAPTHHTDGRPVRYRAPLRLVVTDG